MLEKQYFIPEPEEFIAESPMTAELKRIKKAHNEEIRDVIAGRRDKMLVVVGPCSAHEPAPTLEYISRLGKLNEKLNEIEKLRAENRMLKAQSKQQEIEIYYLKTNIHSICQFHLCHITSFP